MTCTYTQKPTGAFNSAMVKQIASAFISDAKPRWDEMNAARIAAWVSYGEFNRACGMKARLMYGGGFGESEIAVKIAEAESLLHLANNSEFVMMTASQYDSLQSLSVEGIVSYWRDRAARYDEMKVVELARVAELESKVESMEKPVEYESDKTDLNEVPTLSRSDWVKVAAFATFVAVVAVAIS